MPNECELQPVETDEQFLNRVYQEELGREPDGEGFKYWLDDMNIRGETRDQVVAFTIMVIMLVIRPSGLFKGRLF